MKYKEFFRAHPVFTGEEMTEYLLSCGKVGSRTKEVLLAYHKEVGHLVSVRRGLYAVIPPGADPASYSIDPFLIAAKLTKDAVLSYHTALEFHGRAYSAHEHLVYMTSHPLRSFTFRAHLFRGVKFPESLRRAGRNNFGVVAMDRSGMQIRVTSLERTMVDLLSRPDLSGGWEEIWRSLESIEFFDLDKVVEYTLLLKNATTAAKVGFFLEQHRETLMVENKHLKILLSLRPKRPHYLERSKRRSGSFISNWNLVVPQDVLKQSWAEVL